MIYIVKADLNDKLKFRLSALVSKLAKRTMSQACHSERSVSGVEESTHLVNIYRQIGARILRRASLAQDDIVILTVVLIKADNHNSNLSLCLTEEDI